MKYLPLPKELRLGFSKIHDIGLFAKEKINRGRNLGISHIQIGKELFRTPLGGFINHSDEANCELVEDEDPEYKRVRTTRKITAGEELTLKYSMYEICDYLDK